MTEGDGVPDPWSGPGAAVRWVLHTDHGAVVFLREAASSAIAVGMVGLLLFAVSGVWPPLVAVESGSMEPHLERGDLVFVMDEGRLSPEFAEGDTGIVTYAAGQEHDYFEFADYGDVIIYKPYGSDGRTPVIHRARFWVEADENWYDEANAQYVDAPNCEQLANCPAPHDGFITKGDANGYYDQAKGISSPVRPAWIRGTAEFHIPWLGWVRLTFSETMASAATAGTPAFSSGFTGTDPLESTGTEPLSQGSPASEAFPGGLANGEVIPHEPAAAAAAFDTTGTHPVSA